MYKHSFIKITFFQYFTIDTNRNQIITNEHLLHLKYNIASEIITCIFFNGLYGLFTYTVQNIYKFVEPIACFLGVEFLNNIRFVVLATFVRLKRNLITRSLNDE